MKRVLAFFMLGALFMVLTGAGPNLRSKSQQEALNVLTTSRGMATLTMASGTSDSTWHLLEYDSTTTQLYRWWVYSSAAVCAITAYYQYDSTGTPGVVTVGSAFTIPSGVVIPFNPSVAVDSIKIDRTSATAIYIWGVY